MTVAIVSVITGGYDEPKPIVEQDIDCVATLVVDKYNENVDDGWAQQVIHPGEDSRVAAKAAKIRPWDVADWWAEPIDAWIYVDASFQITSPSFAREILAQADSPVSQYRHPQRDCIYDEAAFTAQYAAKYADVPVLDQAAHYATTGHPRNWGLWNTGVIVYREPVEYLAALWEAEIRRWGPQCQISQPVALRRAGVRPHTLPGVVYDTPWMTHHAHNDGTR